MTHVSGFAILLAIILAGCQREQAALVPDTLQLTAAAQRETEAASLTDVLDVGPGVPQTPQTENSAADIVEQIEASVVHVQTDQIRLDDFNRLVPFSGAGTGVVLDTRGFLLTNNHVIRDATRILVKLADGRVFQAEEIGRDAPTDLAVIQIDAVGLSPITLGDSSKLRVGDEVIAVGHALDLSGGPTVTGGLVSAFRRRITDVDQNVTLRHLIQTDAAINLGNSGGPLLNMSGEMVGLNTSTIPTADGISFALAMAQARPLIDDIISLKSVDRGFLGINSVSVTEVVAMNLGLPVQSGVIIVRIVPDSPADRANLEVNDVIVDIEGQAVVTGVDLDSILSRFPPGATIDITFVRDGTRHTVGVPLAERPR